MSRIVPYHELAREHSRTSKVVNSWGVKVNSRSRIQVGKLSDGGYALCFRRRREKGIVSELKFTLSAPAVVALVALFMRSPLGEDAARASRIKREKRNPPKQEAGEGGSE